MSDAVRKRSVTIAGHRTSVSLEEPFWRELAALAAHRGISIAALIEEIDAARTTNLSSAIRIYILTAVKGRAEATVPIP